MKPTAVIKNVMLINDELIHSAWHLCYTAERHCRRTLPKDTAEGHCGDINRLISFISTNYIFDFRIDANNDWNNDK